jgi:hypothetical protein
MGCRYPAKVRIFTYKVLETLIDFVPPLYRLFYLSGREIHVTNHKGRRKRQVLLPGLLQRLRMQSRQDYQEGRLGAKLLVKMLGYVEWVWEFRGLGRVR